MPRKSSTENVRKICGCAKWKTCAHPWYLDYQREKVRYRDNLDKLIDRHCKDFAEAKDEARRAIVAKLEGRDPKGLVPADDPTVGELLDAFDAERPRQDRWQIGRIKATDVLIPDGIRPLGTVRASTLTPDILKAFRAKRPLVAGNRDLALLRAVCNWAVLGGLLPSSPFRVGDVPAVRLGREEARTRRLQPGESERLLGAAGGLRDLITAALETGCRKGELLSLQWHQVRFSPRAEIFLPAQKTKAKKDRRVPISSELRKVLERRRLDPAGEPVPFDGYVFGDEIGRRRGSIKTAWTLTCKRAKVDDLHFHDLRREAGSRWMDAGIPLATIQRWLGHANIAQTSTYLGASHGADELDMRYFEERIGRLQQKPESASVDNRQIETPLTQIDVSCRPIRHEPTSTDLLTAEIPQQNTIIH
jgi:integrase